MMLLKMGIPGYKRWERRKDACAYQPYLPDVRQDSVAGCGHPESLVLPLCNERRRCYIPLHVPSVLTQMLNNSAQGWGLVARNLHWLMAALILFQAVLGKYAHELAISPQKLSLLVWHKSIGITLLFLVLIRLVWALSNRRPESPSDTQRWQQLAARISHGALYTLMIAVPVSGWLFNSAKNVPFRLFRTIPWPSLMDANEELAPALGEIHENLVIALFILVGIHASAALWHHFVRHDEVLRRMLRGEPSR
jgi:cytochrome b561